MNPKLTAVLLILAAVLANIGFTALGSIFNYPDVLNEPAGEVLADFRAHEGAVSTWFTVLALSAALLAPIAIGVGRLSARARMRFAVPVGIAAAVVQVIGLARWPILVPGYAADGDTEAFRTASDILGTAIGETLGYLLTAVWTALVVVALGRSSAAGSRRSGSCRRRWSSSACSRRSSCRSSTPRTSSGTSSTACG